jgi:DNA polymerase-3 subunit alpha
MDTVALTDHGNLYGALTFAQTMKTEKIKAIIGCEFYTCDDMNKRESLKRNHLILLCKNAVGYQNLMLLSSKSFVEGFYQRPRIDLELLARHSSGLICLSACLAGAIPQHLLNGDYDGALAYARRLQGIFGEDFYIEIQDHGIREERQINTTLVRLAREIGAELVATNDVHYLNKADADVQDTLTCISMVKKKNDPARAKLLDGDEFYLKSPEEMEELFSWVPEAVSNTLKVADKCQFLFPFKSDKYFIPEFYASKSEYQVLIKDMPPEYEPRVRAQFERDVEKGLVPKGADIKDTASTYLRRLTYAKLRERYHVITDEVDARMEKELDVIIDLGYAEYYLVVWDFINYAKLTGVPVGPGRGSGAGSLVAYVIEITDIDPLRFDLIFERFLNKDRVSMPDFDIDFCENRRGEVIKYVVEKYGYDNVSQIIAYSTLSAKAAIKDVARVYDVPFGDANEWVKGLPYGKITIEGCLGKGPKPAVIPEFKKLYDSDETAHKVIDTAMQLEGMPRQPSIHAAGVVICQDAITNHCPLQKNGSDITTQFDKNQVEQLGLLKMDFLGLTTLTDIALALEYVKENQGIDLDFSKIGDDDQKVYELISGGDTTAVFQLESGGMTQFMSKLKPESIEDITAGISIYRPGPMQFMDQFIDGKNKPETVRYMHPLLEPILNVTYGCIVYQEQVMRIATDLGGYTAGGADILRKAMGKKDAKTMQQHKEYFVRGNAEKKMPGAMSKGVPEAVADALFEQILKFSEYAFNKAHAAAYAVLTYRTAYLKCYYMLEFLTAVINNRLTKQDRLPEYINYVRSRDIKLLQPDINKSGVRFTIENGNMRFGLMGIKNVGEGALTAIIADRTANGEYRSLYDFTERAAALYTSVDDEGKRTGSVLNKRMIESLIKGGAFDCFGINRHSMLACYDQVVDMVQAEKKSRVEGQMSFFDTEEELKTEFAYPKLPDEDPIKKLAAEKEVLGMYVSGHPLDDYRGQSNDGFPLGALVLSDPDHIAEDEESGGTVYDTSLNDKRVTLYGLVQSVTQGFAKKSKRAFLKGEFEDLTGSITFMMFTDALNPVTQFSAAKLTSGGPLRIKGSLVIRDGETPLIFVNSATEWEKASTASKTGGSASSAAAGEAGGLANAAVRIRLKDFEQAKALMPLLRAYPGNSPVYGIIDGDEKQFKIAVFITDDLLIDLRARLGRENVEIIEKP